MNKQIGRLIAVLSKDVQYGTMGMKAGVLPKGKEFVIGEGAKFEGSLLRLVLADGVTTLVGPDCYALWREVLTPGREPATAPVPPVIWSTAQVESINAYQASDYMHALTGADGRPLIATPSGLVADIGGPVVQTRVPAQLLDGSWREMERRILAFRGTAMGAFVRESFDKSHSVPPSPPRPVAVIDQLVQTPGGFTLDVGERMDIDGSKCYLERGWLFIRLEGGICPIHPTMFHVEEPPVSAEARPADHDGAPAVGLAPDPTTSNPFIPSGGFPTNPGAEHPAPSDGIRWNPSTEQWQYHPPADKRATPDVRAVLAFLDQVYHQIRDEIAGSKPKAAAKSEASDFEAYHACRALCGDMDQHSIALRIPLMLKAYALGMQRDRDMPDVPLRVPHLYDEIPTPGDSHLPRTWRCLLCDQQLRVPRHLGTPVSHSACREIASGTLAEQWAVATRQRRAMQDSLALVRSHLAAMIKRSEERGDQVPFEVKQALTPTREETCP